MSFSSMDPCVLLFLILSFITAPTQSFTSVMVKLNQSAVLPCEQNCSDSLRWTVIDKPGLVVAQCDQTSCRSEKEGFTISHDQYLRGDLSLTITAAHYSIRGLYTCQCDGKDTNTAQLSMETLMISSKLNPGEDLILHLHVSDHMELTYKSKSSSDLYGDLICNVTLSKSRTEDSLQCKEEYKQRASLRGSDLILENIKPPDSGVYTVRDGMYKEIILIYTLSVKDHMAPLVKVKRHGSVTLSSTRNCTGLVKWINNKRNVVAWCNQTQCGSEEGYKMSPDQYLKGDFSLSITEAYYSMRGLYCCMCEEKCISEFNVSVEIENSSVQLKPGEDLLMDLPRSEPLEVFYRRTRSTAEDADGKNICTLVDGSLECVDGYTHRMSSVLKLEHVNKTDCGVYTIQSQTSHEVFLIYKLSVKEDQTRPDKEICVSYQVFWLITGSALGLITIAVSVCLYLKCRRMEHERAEDRQSTLRCCPVGYSRNDLDPSTRSQLMD